MNIRCNTVILFVSLNFVTFTLNGDRSNVLEDCTHVLELTYALLFRFIDYLVYPSAVHVYLLRAN